MAHWLIKSEPHKYSWDDMVRDGRTHWDGIRSHQAAANLKAMAVGDTALFYHSNDGKEAVGIVDVVRGAYPDPSDATGKFVMVDVAARSPLPRPVTLAALKADGRFADLALVRQSRLSVVPISDDHWAMIMAMAGI